MPRNWGIMNGPAGVRGASTDRPVSIGKYAPSNSVLFSPAEPPLESRDITDAFRDVIAVGFAFLFISTVSLVFTFALFVLFFVQT